jgi:hypothetical protein
MVEALPTPIVRALRELERAVVAVSQRQVDDTLAHLEEAVLTAVRQALPALLTAVVQQSQRSLWAQDRTRSWPCPTCGQGCGVQSWRSRTVLTICGRLTVERPWCCCPACGAGFSPTDQTLALVPRGRLSATLADWLATEGADSSFAEAAARVARLTGLVVSPETVRQRTEAAGASLEATHQAAATTVQETREAAAPVDLPPGRLVVEADGVMVRYRDGWHEVKTGVVGGHEAKKLRAASYTAQRGSPEAFGPRLLAEAARRGALDIVDWEGSPLQRRLAVLREVVVVGDGAPWIWHLAAEHFGCRIEIVDFYHASQHVWAAAKALYGEMPDAAGWANAQLDELWEQGVAPLQAALAAAQGATPEAQEALRRERGYFRTNAARMDYPRYRAAGLPCGSGAVESAARHLVQQRLKLAGARWSEAGAQYVLNVRCARKSASHKAA